MYSMQTDVVEKIVHKNMHNNNNSLIFTTTIHLTTVKWLILKWKASMEQTLAWKHHILKVLWIKSLLQWKHISMLAATPPLPDVVDRLLPLGADVRGYFNVSGFAVVGRVSNGVWDLAIYIYI